MLLVIFLLVDNDVAVDQEVVKEKELPGFGFLPTHFREDSFPDKDSSRDGERLTGAAETALDQCNAPSIGLTVHCKERET